MIEMSIQAAKSAYEYPLLLKQLWHAPLVQAPDQVIVYRDIKRFTYRQLRNCRRGSPGRRSHWASMFFAGYGMSESAPLLSVAQVKSADLIGDPEKALDIRTKAGIPVPLVDIRLVDRDLNEVPHDGQTPGEVVVARAMAHPGICRQS